MRPFNINETVRVKLTPEGRAMHATNHTLLWASEGKKPPYAYKPPVEDAEGFSSWQLWSLMQEFGPHIHMGMQIPFEGALIYFVEDKSEVSEKEQEGRPG